MSDNNQIPLNQLHDQQKGVVVQIQGGSSLANRLNVLGIRPGKKITKISSAFLRGPITIQVDRVQVAIGFGMARKIIIEPS
jgi:ferrous iron transport protein A